MAKPFLKWAGGKTQLLPHLKHWSPAKIDTYYEPFLGGGALFFALESANRFDYAVLSDVNPEIINAFQQVRDRPDDLLGVLGGYQTEYLRQGQDGRARFFYEKRDATPMFEVEEAARTIFLNKTCFNGLYRVNAGGAFNVPHGRYKTPTICDESGIRSASAALQRAELMSSDFEVAVSRMSLRDFAYFDPPYVPLSDTSNFTAYTSDAFGMAEQVRLADVVQQLKNRGGQFLLSNSSHPDVAELYKERGFVPRAVLAGRMINSNAAARGPVREFLIGPSPPHRPKRSPASTRARGRRTSGARLQARQSQSRALFRARRLGNRKGIGHRRSPRSPG